MTSTFSVDTSGEVHEVQLRAGAGGNSGGVWHQTFDYNAGSGQWTVRNIGSNGWVFTGTSGPNGHIVTITGSQIKGLVTVPVRERYVFTSATKFEHTWEQQNGANWRVTSHAFCTIQQQ